MSTKTKRYTTDPKTGRRILVGGPTWKKLYGDGRKRIQSSSQTSSQKSSKTGSSTGWRKRRAATYKHSDGRGSRTRGWAVDAPQRGMERGILKQVCGDDCFLEPETLGFPICGALSRTPRSKWCESDQRGITSAYIRARQYSKSTGKRRGHAQTARKAKKLQRKRA